MKLVQLAVLIGLGLALLLKINDLEERQSFCDRFRTAQIDNLVEMKKKILELELKSLAQAELIGELATTRRR